MSHPTAFISYAWESPELKKWVKDLAKKLREEGVDVKLDQWELEPGDQMTHFMEKSVRENNYILIICTPSYKNKSEERKGGVGYEGDIMTGEVLESANHRKFIPILKTGNKNNAIPSWLKGKYFIDLTIEEDFDKNYPDLITTIFNAREKAPPLGKPKFQSKEREFENNILKSQEVKIKGILIDEVTQPKLDGTRGSALYKIPFELNKRPDYEWIDIFIKTWNLPPKFSTMHRPGIATVVGNKIMLDGTEIEEVEKYHKETLKLCIQVANEEYSKIVEKRNDIEAQKAKDREEQLRKIRDFNNRMDF
ncbi:toll/interleukin-1 receptor domain-containing protein [Autumnicola musiva]|uniref:Toll/interleukin-1 receptor domain-containing protein n=1 Tax=Autumnicola musiva TaxID=3075589 RepID=A0ABU3DAX4_9FLAO|nr:toll/interleukin-1 receptor domain-containing protein [Zunongwangia sp. F117]MDT0678685.1 toll/interleukin-1 receptor domain-containing protein [Zunongwangia sp. F117]